MKITIDEQLNKLGKKRYWLSKEVGMTYQNIMRLCNGQTNSIKFELLEKICKTLNCTPNDIFEFKEDFHAE